MKTHEHALISLGYAAGLSLISGQGLGGWEIYLAALVGGEIIDFVDHPMYHLVYNRNEPHVKKARKIFQEEGLKSTVKYLNDVENNRKFKGLLLHNIYSLSILAFLSILAAFFLPAPTYLFVGIGAFFLHMLTDLWGDYSILGHVDNWLWVLTKKNIDSLGSKGNNLVNYILVWGAFIQTGFILVTTRWIWQLNRPTIFGMAFEESLYNIELLAYIPLGGLAIYHLSIIGICAANVHKYKLEMENPKKSVPFSVGSIKLLGKLIRRKIPQNRQNFERVYLRMQADQAIWATFLTLLITIVLVTISWIWGGSSTWNIGQTAMFVLTPVFLALLFGTMLHTTVGEFGGVWGVLLAILLNLILGRLGLQEIWSINLGYWLFGSAVGAWILALLGGIILRGQSRMSLTAFSFRFEAINKDNDRWLQDILAITRESLSKGYSQMHETFHGPSDGIDFVSMPSTDLMLTPYQGKPILGEEYHHLRASDNYSPILRTFSYALCENRLTSTSKIIGKYGILPIMPRQRTVGKNILDSEMYLDGNKYFWKSKKRPLKLLSAGMADTNVADEHRWLLHKSWSEFLDHMITRGETIQTDIFIFPEEGSPDVITVCGITREYTSTKAYATVEAEAYAGAVVNEIKEMSKKNQHLKIAKLASARLFYPRTSFFDLDLIDWVERVAVLPTESGGFQRQDLSYIQQTISQLPDKKIVLSATADFQKKLGILSVQYLITILIGYLNVRLSWAAGILEFIKELF